MKALVLDAWTRAAVSVVQSLGRLGVEVHAVSDHPCLAFRSRYVSAKLRGADGGPERLLAWLHEHNEREQYTLIVPSSEVSLRAIQALPDGDILRGKAVLASRASVATALDKMETRELAQRLGVRVPPSRVLLADSPAPPAPDYPIVLKTAASQVLVGGSYRYAQPCVARSLWERQRFLDEWSEHCPIEEQRFVPGRGWGVACLYDRGRLQWHFTHERLHEIPLTGGASTYRRAAAMNEELVGPARTVLDALGWHGVAMVEFRVDESGGVTFLEINPRLWGSLPLSAKAGVDFAAGLLGLARGEQLPDAPSYRVGCRMRALGGDLVWMRANWGADHRDPLLLTRPRASSAFEWLRPAVSAEGWDFVSLRDPGPGAAELLGLGARLIRAATGRARDIVRRLGTRRLHDRNIGRFLQRRPVRPNVVFVCHGNVCRSPLAEVFARERFEGWDVSSTGLHATAGRATPSRIRDAARQIGADLSGHRATVLSREAVDRADLLVVMDRTNLLDLLDRFPEARGKAILLGLFDNRRSLTIPDPIALDEAGALASANKVRRAVDKLGALVTGSGSLEGRPRTVAGGVTPLG